MKSLIGYMVLAAIGLSAAATRYFKVNLPEHFPATVYNFQQNPVSEAGIELGRILFYDPVLSVDSSTSCASCHSPFNAFAHTDHALSHGIHDSIGTRNAPALFNLAWQRSFMWDGAINHIDVQALAPISHPAEMGEDIAHVVKKLARIPGYPEWFGKAFGSDSITGEYVLKALAAFQLTLISANSKYDRVRQGKDEFSEQELNGYHIFQKNCNSCHLEPLFSTYEFANNGLPIDTTLNDVGKMKISQKESDSLLFKIPSLRNLSYTSPYMHDGRFNKLSQVINHYTSGIEKSSTLSDKLKTPIVLGTNEKTDLIAFLLTLNDREFVFNPEFQYIGIPKINPSSD